MAADLRPRSTWEVVAVGIVLAGVLLTVVGYYVLGGHGGAGAVAKLGLLLIVAGGVFAAYMTTRQNRQNPPPGKSK